MFRKIFLINMGLFVIILLLSYNVYTIWSQVLTQLKSPPVQIELPKRAEPVVEDEDEEPDYAPSSRMSYSSIVEKDLFRPEREEWQPPPPPEEEEVDVKQSSPYPQFPGQVPQQEMKKPDLFGIIIIGEANKYAIMQGFTREEQQERTRKIRLGDGSVREVPLPPLPGQIKKDKISAYRIGDYVSEAQVVDIQPDMVIMETEEGERYELLLREPTKLEMWKPALAEGQSGEEPGAFPGQPGVGIPGMQPIPVPPGVPVYPYVPAYPLPPPPGYVPPGAIPPQVGQGPPIQTPLPPTPQPQQQRILPNQPGFPPGGLRYPPGQPYPGVMRR